jgi:histone H3/H4
MFMGGSNTSLFGGGGRKSIFRSVDQSADVVGVVSDAATRVGSSVGRVADAAAETVSHVVGGIRQASAAVADRASRTAGQAADAIASAATSAAHEVQETGSKWGNTVQQNIAELFERQPLLLGAVGLAIGAGVAASIPTTETENKVMGDASDFVRDAVSEKAAKVREMAGAAADEAKKQGLTPEGAGEAMRTLGDKLSAVQRPR